MPIVYRNPNDLIPYENNAKTHPNGQIEQIVKLIERFGFPESKAIAVDEDNVILHGHGRRLAAIAANLESVPTETIEGLSDEDKQAWRIADNAVAESEWDWAKLEQEIEQLKAVDYDLELLALNENILSQLKSLEIEENNSNYDESEDDVPDVEEVEPRCKEGEIWELGRHRLLCGDCTDKSLLQRFLGDRVIDLIVTDPPYGVSYADKNKRLNAITFGNRIQTPIKNDHLTVEEIPERLWFPVFRNLFEFAKPGCNYYIYSPQGGELMMMMMMMIQKAGWQLKHGLVWIKNNHVLGGCDYQYKHEPILYGWKPGSHYFIDSRSETSVWEFDKPLKSDLHPTMKPVEMLIYAINNSSKINDLVFDSFLGSGSTLIACDKCDRTCYGVEIDLHYCEVIMQRYEKLTGQQARLLVSSAVVQGTF